MAWQKRDTQKLTANGEIVDGAGNAFLEINYGVN